MINQGKIGVLIEDHFDQTEYRKFNDFFPSRGYEVEYLTHLWGQPQLSFGGNPDDGVITEHATVRTEVNHVKPGDYRGVICIGAYAMDRLRYESNPRKGVPNQAPAVAFIRKALQSPGPVVGAICHGLWLLCADKSLLTGRKVTCAHNIISDVENAGGEVVFEGDQTAEVVVEGNLVTAKHPGVTDRFLDAFVREIEKVPAQP